MPEWRTAAPGDWPTIPQRPEPPRFDRVPLPELVVDDRVPPGSAAMVGADGTVHVVTNTGRGGMADLDLADWLTRQYDEDEALARAAALTAGPTDGTPGPEWTVHYDAVTASGGTVATGIEGSLDKAVSAHIACWDPARVLAEIAAKRRRVALHRAIAIPYDDRHGTQGIEWGCAECGTDEPGSWPCETVLTDAAPYAGLPGWKDEWAIA